MAHFACVSLRTRVSLICVSLLYTSHFLHGPGTLWDKCYQNAAWLRSFITLYTSLAKHGRPPPLPRAKDLGDGTWEVTTYGLSGHGWLGLVSDDMLIKVIVKGQPKQFNPLTQPAGLTGILGPGNFDGPFDLMHALFLENRVVVFKANPVVKETAPVLQKILKPLISRGYLAMLIGGVKIGQAITSHALADKEKKQKQLTKPIKAENWVQSTHGLYRQAQHLVSAKMFNAGHICASPQVILTSKNWSLRQGFLAAVKKHLESCPGTTMYYPQSEEKYKTAIQTLASELKLEIPSELKVQHQAEESPVEKSRSDQSKATVTPAAATHDETLRTSSESPLLLSVASDTTQSQRRISLVDTSMDQELEMHGVEVQNNQGKELTDWKTPTTQTEELKLEIPFDFEVRSQEMCIAKQTACIFSTNLSQQTELAQIEGFCPVLVEIPLDTQPTVTGFLQEAVRFANENMWGSLTGTIVIDDGTLGINKWAGYGIIFPQGSWGAYPKHTPEDIQSGQGITGNVWCLENVVSTRLDCPFAYLSVPNCHRSLQERRVFMSLQKCLAEFFLDPGLFLLARVISALVLKC
eukprot:g24345.t1